MRAGLLDRPRRGHVRAVEPSAREYTTDDWRLALLAAVGAEPISREQAIERAAAWARENLGRDYKRLRKGGVIETGLGAALRSMT